VGAAYGDAFLAGLATDRVSLAELESNWVRIVRRFTPDPVRRELYQPYYEIYRGLYPHTLEDMHALARLGRASLSS
ncbi:MAG: sugar kinase, partial [Anaerolineae bacterium]|nr:sugar kinase [Anaerolineae bacterium]